MKLSVLVAIAFSICSGSASSLGENTSFIKFDTSRLELSSFLEQFDYNSLEESGWKVSQAKKGDESYVGQWSLELSSVYPGFHDDMGLVMKTPAAHHAISYRLAEPFNNTGRDLVLQYEIKPEKGMNCGGTYIKLLDYPVADESQFNNETPYQIMFGPDKCGASNKVHFIVKRENPNTHVLEEKHMTFPPLSRTGKLTTLYTLILKNTQDYEIRINGKVAKAGNLVSDLGALSPPLNPSKDIIDVTDFQPLDWDDNEFIPDPEVTLPPEGYREKYASTDIDDPNAVKPDDWDESEPEYIPNPAATIPEEWDVEEDGEWEAPLIRNPVCVSQGCGPWIRPRIPNPDYLGPWIRPMIPNPNYMGEWQPRSIPNVHYFEDSRPSDLKLIGGLGFELWSMDNNVFFDNIYLGHSIEEAEIIGNETFVPKSALENASLEKNRPRAKNEPVPPPRSFEDLYNDDSVSTWTQFVAFIKACVLKTILEAVDFYAEFMSNPVPTLMHHPFKFVGYCIAFLFTFTIVFGTLSTVMFIINGPPTFDEVPQTKDETNGDIRSDEKEEKEIIVNRIGNTGSSRFKESTRRRT